MTKYIFVTGGVVSSLGKGIAAASLAAILETRGLKISMLKLDPYINVDPGTMSPFQHGEVFVTEDGAETDLDLGHYERFIDQDLTGSSPIGVLPFDDQAKSTPLSALNRRSSRSEGSRTATGSCGRTAFATSTGGTRC